MDKYGILAFPAHHSLSPAMHNAGFKALNIEAKYEFFEIHPRDLEAFIQKVRKENIKGLSVSKPHKEAIIPLLDEIDNTAQKIGAVNTVYWRKNKLVGTNVDWIGVEKAILEKTEIEGKKAVILGAGGAARAAVYALQNNHAKSVTVLNRTLSHAKALAEDFFCDYGELDDFESFRADILVQATSAGLNKKEGVEVVEKELLKPEMTVMDMIYTPLETRIIKDAREIGAKTITGDRMLLYQGVAAFEIWTSKKAPIDVMDRAIKKRLY